jgi:hypothetical protein
MLSDTQWALLEPLIGACRPKGKTPPQDLRRTLSATCGGIRTEPSGGLSLRSWDPGGGRPRSSSAGHALASGSAC